MSRLVGKQQDHSLLIVFLIIIGFGIAGGLEYLGITNFVTNFGREISYPSAPKAVEESVEENLN